MGSTYRERREAKAEQLRVWADGRDAKADQAYAGVRSISDRIPLGQPILVGHYSERGARADVRRIEAGMDRFCEHAAKASGMRSRAENIERAAATSIYSDDPDAVDRLREKVAKLEAQRDHIKSANAAYKRAHGAELRALESAFARDRAMPFPSYHLKNLSATIRTTRKRLEELSTPETGRTLVAKYAGECRACGGAVAAGETVRYFRRSREVEHEACPVDTDALGA